MSTHKYTNDLIDETSPYLLQHAHNPVNWHAWNEATLALALKEHKPILISIGYSACHWCHVMEHESFENEEVAAVLNASFICIKVDREERPDVDLVYMNAIQAITGQGGWPLNMFALPDGRPFHGGTYFKKEDFMRVLNAVSAEFKNNEAKLIEFADQLQKGIIKQEQAIQQSKVTEFSDSTIIESMANWKGNFDSVWGGDDKAPKFPLPNNYLYLMQVAHSSGDSSLLNHVNNSLIRMARGGIYDQIRGGFARYSTDKYWKVPHFEKMLYDNGQLLSLYANAYKLTKRDEYKRVIDETVNWLMKEMRNQDDFFYSALDADSEGEEGKFYVWTEEELKKTLGKDFDFAVLYFNVNKLGFWEHQNYILMRDGSDELLAKEQGIDLRVFEQKVEAVKAKLLIEREKRIRPGLDDKSLTSWNALTVIGLLDAYQATGNNEYAAIAEKTLIALTTVQMDKNGKLWRNYKEGKSTISGFLDDYAFLGLACVKMYESNFDEKWLDMAVKLANYTLIHFYDTTAGFYYNAAEEKGLMMRPTEVYDNVIPASSSAMAHLLFQLSAHTNNNRYEAIAKTSVLKWQPLIARAASSFSNWAMLYQNFLIGSQEIVIVGEKAEEFRKELQHYYLPMTSFAGGTKDSNLPLVEGRFSKGETLIYICKDKTCLLPVKSVKEALKLLN
jgi:uncharacterized protein